MKKLIAVLLVLVLALCALPAMADESTEAATVTQTPVEEFGGLTYTGSMELDYANQFRVDYYEGGYSLTTLVDGVQVLVVPEGASTPEGLPENVIVVNQPVTDMLISSTPTTSLINAIGRLDTIKYTTNDLDSWYIDEVKAAMEAGEITYIGSYKEPDFEVLAAEPPMFSVFSTMLDSVPDVADKLDELGIKYIRDYATYENHPLARVEWVKLYGALLGEEEAAQAAYDEQKQMVESLGESQTGKTCVMFYITSKGTLHVRNGSDYMARMLELAGGEYALSDFNPNQTGAEQMEMEEFYSRAADADYIIYIWSLGGKPETLADFTAKWELLSEFKAVKDGNVFCTTPDYFQITNTLGDMIVDMNTMLTGSDAPMEYLFKLQ